VVNSTVKKNGKWQIPHIELMLDSELIVLGPHKLLVLTALQEDDGEEEDPEKDWDSIKL
jgi:hypothetical protein